MRQESPEVEGIDMLEPGIMVFGRDASGIGGGAVPPSRGIGKGLNFGLRPGKAGGISSTSFTPLENVDEVGTGTGVAGGNLLVFVVSTAPEVVSDLRNGSRGGRLGRAGTACSIATSP